MTTDKHITIPERFYTVNDDGSINLILTPSQLKNVIQDKPIKEKQTKEEKNEKQRIRMRNYYYANHEKCTEQANKRTKEYYKRNREKILEKLKQKRLETKISQEH